MASSAKVLQVLVFLFLTEVPLVFAQDAGAIAGIIGGVAGAIVIILLLSMIGLAILCKVRKAKRGGGFRGRRAKNRRWEGDAASVGYSISSAPFSAHFQRPVAQPIAPGAVPVQPGGAPQEGGGAPGPAGAQQLGQTNFAGFPAALPYVVQWQMNNWGAARVPAPLAAQYQQMLHRQALMQPGNGVLPPQLPATVGPPVEYRAMPAEYMNLGQAQAQAQANEQQQVGAAYPAEQHVLPLDYYDDFLGPPKARLEQSLKWKYGERRELQKPPGPKADELQQQPAPQPPAPQIATLREQPKPQLPAREPPLPKREEPQPLPQPQPQPLPSKEQSKPQKALPPLPPAHLSPEDDGYEEVQVQKSTLQKAVKHSQRPPEHEAYAVSPPKLRSNEPTYMEGRYAVAGYKLTALAGSSGSYLPESDPSKRSSAAAAYAPETSYGVSPAKNTGREEVVTYSTSAPTHSSPPSRRGERETAIDSPPAATRSTKRGVVVEYEGLTRSTRREDEVEVVEVGGSGPSVGYWSGEVNGGVAYYGSDAAPKAPGVGYWSGEVNGGVGYTNAVFSSSEEALSSFHSTSYQVTDTVTTRTDQRF